MNFLVDANLPPRLCQWFHHRGHQATHLLELHSLKLPDKQVWALAVTRQDVIITKDSTELTAGSRLIVARSAHLEIFS